MEQPVMWSQRDQVFEIALNVPAKRNAINWNMAEQLHAALDAAARADGVRAIVLRGEGSVFSAGIDLHDFAALPSRYGDRWAQQMRTITDDWQRLTTRLERIEVPTIALLHGVALGLAFEIALACDFRLAAAGTRMGLPETRLGLVPDVGGTTRLTRLVGVGRAKELILTGKLIDAAQAERWGIVNEVVEADDLVAAVDRWAAELAHAAPLAVGMAKRVIDGLFDTERGLLLEGWAQSHLITTEDLAEGIQAAVERRAAQFKGR